MDERPKRDSDMPNRDHRPHHIANIAHHFFDENLEEGVEGISVEHCALLPVSVLVGCASGDSLAAGICAQLARAYAVSPPEQTTDLQPGCDPSPLGRVLLSESPWVPWSAISHLSAGLARPVDGDEIPPEVGFDQQGQRLFWEINGVSDAWDLPDNFSPVSMATLVLHNLGSLNNSQLDKLETLEFSSTDQIMTLPKGQRLVWCLDQASAGSFRTAYFLGRVMALFQPRHLEIMLVGQPTAGMQPLPTNEWDRSYPHIRAVAGNTPCHFSFLPRSPSVSEAEMQALFVQPINRIMSRNSN